MNTQYLLYTDHRDGSVHLIPSFLEGHLKNALKVTILFIGTIEDCDAYIDALIVINKLNKKFNDQSVELLINRTLCLN